MAGLFPRGCRLKGGDTTYAYPGKRAATGRHQRPKSNAVPGTEGPVSTHSLLG
jgi:hypothetical protein